MKLRTRLMSATAAAAGVAVLCTGCAGAATAHAATAHAAVAPKTVNLAGWQFETAYTSGFDKGDTYHQYYTGSHAVFIGLAGPLKGSDTKDISYIAVSLGHDQIEILLTFPSGLPKPFPNGLQDVIIFNLKTGVVSTATTIPGANVPWTPSAGTVKVLKRGGHPIP